MDKRGQYIIGSDSTVGNYRIINNFLGHLRLFKWCKHWNWITDGTIDHSVTATSVTLTSAHVDGTPAIVNLGYTLSINMLLGF